MTTPSIRIGRRLPRLEPRHRFLLAVLGGMSFFDGYDRAIVTLALLQIRHTFGLSEAQASWWLAIVFLGSAPAIVVSRYADRVGRRPLLLMSLAGYTVATGATALSPTIGIYVACQFVARIFLTTEAAVAWAFAAEELPAQHRGFGFGWLAMSAALGVGFGAILFGGVFDPLGISWRWLYVAGLPPLLALAFVRRRLPESSRFTANEGPASDERGARWSALFRRPHIRWLVLATTTALLLELTTQASVFAIDFLQSARGLSTQAANLMLVGAGIPGIPVMVIAGSLSDRLGRRFVGCSCGLAALAGAAGFFWLPGGIPVFLPALTLVVVGQMAAWPVLAGYGTELFPTRLRSEAGAWVAVARVIGDSTSLGLGALLLGITGGLPQTVSILALGPLVAILIVAVAFPDTHGVELESITGDLAGRRPSRDPQRPVLDPLS